MKKYIYILTILLAAAACSEKTLGETDSRAGLRFCVNIEDSSTKVAVGEKSGTVYPLSWQTGDRLIVNGTVLTNPLDAAFDGLKQAEFTTPVSTTYPATLVYPAAVQGGAGYILVPSEQTLDSAHPGNGYGLLTGYVTEDGLTTLKHASAYVKVSITGSATIKSVILSAPGSEMLAGRFKVDGASGELTHVPSPTDNIESSSCIAIVGERDLSAGAADYVFAVPACQTYSKGLKLTIIDSENKSMARTLFASTGKKLTPGIVYEPVALEYSAGGSPEALFDISESEIEFEGSGYSAREVTITTLGEGITLSKENLLWADADLPSAMPAYRTYTVDIIPATGNPSEVRSGKIVAGGVSTGKKQELAVVQKDLYTPTDGFPCRWFISGTETFVTDGLPNAKADLWMSEGICTPNTEGTGYISATSADGTPLVYDIVAGSSTNTVCVGNLGMGDCINWSVPVTEVAAGTDFDFMLTINSNSDATPKYWVFEWMDGGEWKCDEARLMTAAENSSVKYSIYTTKMTNEENYCTFVQAFSLANSIRSGFVRMRLRAVGSVNSGGSTLKRTASAYIYLPQATWRACTITCNADAKPVTETRKIAAFGNSITYYNGSLFMLKELCRKGGHQLDMRINLKGSREFEHHLYELVRSQAVLREGGYDWAIMQDGSYFHAQYGARGLGLMTISTKYTDAEVLSYSKEMASEIRKYSPDAQILLEGMYSYRQKKSGNVWLGFGSYETFDYYSWKGLTEIAGAVTDINWISPINKAFTRARGEYGFMDGYNNLEHTDNYHPNLYGSYLKACVHYLIITGDDSLPECDCGLPAEDARNLRSAAADIVNSSTREEFHIH